MLKNKKSFTLAEVLITLVVIGIIAAITVPTIMANHKKTETAAKLKKFYSTFVNAVKLAEIEHGIPNESWEWKRCSDKESCMYVFNNYLANHFSYSKITYGSDVYSTIGFVEEPVFAVYLNDGTIMSCSGSESNIFYIDVNGEKGPNQAGRDIFGFYIGSSTEIVIEEDISRDEIIASAKNSTLDAVFKGFQLIMKDGWEIKDDYPYRL